MKAKTSPQLKLGETPGGEKIKAPGLAPMGLETPVQVPRENTRNLDPHIEGEPLWQGGLCIKCGGSKHLGPKKVDGVWDMALKCPDCDGCGDRKTWVAKHKAV